MFNSILTVMVDAIYSRCKENHSSETACNYLEDVFYKFSPLSNKIFFTY
jgi:hypothetical protein